MRLADRIKLLPGQQRRVAEYMHRFGWVTPLDGFRDLGIMRLAARIHDLRGGGFKIKDETFASENRFGERVHFKRYRLEGVPCVSPRS